MVEHLVVAQVKIRVVHNLAQIAVDLEMLHIQFVAAKGADNLGASLCQAVDDVATEEAAAAKDRGGHVANLWGGVRLAHGMLPHTAPRPLAPITDMPLFDRASCA